VHNFQKVSARKADVSPMLDYLCFIARQRAQRAVKLARTLEQASCELNRKIDSMLVELEFRNVVRHAEGDIKQKGLGLLAECLKKRRKPSRSELSRFLSEIKPQ
jgi:hypothetical protein